MQITAIQKNNLNKIFALLQMEYSVQITFRQQWNDNRWGWISSNWHLINLNLNLDHHRHHQWGQTSSTCQHHHLHDLNPHHHLDHLDHLDYLGYDNHCNHRHNQTINITISIISTGGRH